MRRQVTTGKPFVPLVATGIKQLNWLPPPATHARAVLTALLHKHSAAHATSAAEQACSKQPHRALASTLATFTPDGVQATLVSGLPVSRVITSLWASGWPLLLEPQPAVFRARTARSRELPINRSDERMSRPRKPVSRPLI